MGKRYWKQFIYKFFFYFGTPEKFKIILQLPNGELKISETITRKTINATYTLDANTMEVKDITQYSISTYIIPFYVLLTTIIVEACISLAFFKKDRKKLLLIIIITNFITNLLLQIFMNILGENIFLCAELFIMLAEVVTYLILFKNYDKGTIIKYSIFALFIYKYHIILYIIILENHFEVVDNSNNMVL